ncbi:MAG: T9SS type A sorting domain-containing protein [Paludibacter sp.]|nr:T9SS type A sorting domain-containing protein [Paludibacter sp.]
MKKITLFLLFVLSTTALFAQETIVNADFANYTNAALVGQNSWVQYNTNSDRPLTIANGKLTWTGGNTTDGQDALLPFPAVIAQPTEGITTLTFDIVATISATGASPSYFIALNTLNTTSTSSNFQNARIAAKTLEDGFVFGTRVNGQTGYPFVYGTTKLTFGTKYAIRAEIKLVAGNQNDTIKLYVGSDFNNLTLAATSAYTTGTATDPTYGGVLVSQFGSSTVNESGASIESIKVAKQVTSGFNSIDALKFKAVVVGNDLQIKNVANGATVEIFSALGSKVQTSVLENGKVSIDNLSKGMYIVRVGKSTQKFML